MALQKIVLPALLLVIIGLGIYYFTKSPAQSAQSQDLTTVVKKGEFRIFVAATGELKAKNSLKIKAPANDMRSAEIYNTSITDMVPEGTVVKEGAYVATLDKTEIQTKMRVAQTEIDKINTQLEQAEIDTAIELRGIRDQLINLRFAMDERKLELEQSKYEPQMVIQRAEIELQKSDRDIEQLRKKYELTQTKSIAKISEIQASLKQEELKLQKIMNLSSKFTIKAPKDGMVIYIRHWRGKVSPGSEINPWDPEVAELPDLADMITTTFVNEVDISKVKKGQDVLVKVDAFPDNEYDGKVIHVANIGEQLRGYDSKVFEVSIQLNEVDSLLRPAMTTSTEILTYTFPEVLYIPLEALQVDTVSYVFVMNEKRLEKKEVITGETNDNEVIIEHGLAEGDQIVLTIPNNSDNLNLIPLDPAIKEEIKKKQEAEKAKRKAEALKRMKDVKEPFSPDAGGGGNSRVVIFH